MRAAFVTGASGFVGQHLVPELVARGVRVRALVRSDEAAKRVGALGAEPVRGDLDQSAVLSKAMAGCEVVFHLAAEMRHADGAAVMTRVNVLGTQNVLAASRQAKVG